jgi:signal peptidase I
MKSRRRTVATVLTVGVLAALWLTLGPLGYGGGTTYVSTTGVSMEPMFHAGDLALVRPQSDYGSGDVIAYRSQVLGVVVLHRIVVEHSGRYTTRGDNNSWDDPDHPGKDDVMGRLSLRVPRGGVVLHWVRQPVPLAVLGLAMVGPAVGFGARKRRTGRSHRAAAAGTPRLAAGREGGTPRTPAAHPGLMPWAAGLAVAAFALGGIAFNRPATVPGSSKVTYRQALTYDYEARTVPNIVYPDGVVGWGDPVYTRAVRALDVRVGYEFQDESTPPVVGRISLQADLSSSSGWHRQLVATAPAPFTGARTAGSIRLDLDEVRRLVGAVEAATRAPFGQIGIRVSTRVDGTATVGGQPVSVSVTAPLVFSLNEIQLVVANPEARTATAKGDVPLPRAEQNRLALIRWRIPIGWLRIVSILMGIAALLTALAGIVHGRPASVRTVLKRRYSKRAVWARDLDPSLPAIEIGTPEDFFRLADHHGHEPILHGTVDGRYVVFLEFGTTRYRYTVRPDDSAAAEAPPVPTSRAIVATNRAPPPAGTRADPPTDDTSGRADRTDV